MSLNKLMNYNGEGLGMQIATDDLKVSGNTELTNMLVSGNLEVQGDLQVGDLIYASTDILGGGNLVSNGNNVVSVRDYPTANAYASVRFSGVVPLSTGLYPVYTQINAPSTQQVVNPVYYDAIPLGVRVKSLGKYHIEISLVCDIVVASNMEYVSMTLDGSTPINTCQTSSASVGGGTRSFYNLSTISDLVANQEISILLSSLSGGQAVNIIEWSVRVEKLN